MSSSIYAIDSAWAVLKRDELDALGSALTPEDHQAWEQYSRDLSPEQQQALNHMTEIFYQLPPETKQDMIAEMKAMMEHHSGNLSDILGQVPHDELLPFKQSFRKSLDVISKFVPLALAAPVAIGLVFGADAVNRSQGAKSSVVGEAFKSTYNAFVPPAYEFETDWSGVVEYDDGIRYVNPITGMESELKEDPAGWERGLATGVGALSFVNPFSAIGATGRGVGAAGRGIKSARAARLQRTGRAADESKAFRRLDKPKFAEVKDDLWLQNYGKPSGAEAMAATGVKAGGRSRKGAQMQREVDESSRLAAESPWARPEGHSRLRHATLGGPRWARFGGRALQTLGGALHGVPKKFPWGPDLSPSDVTPGTEGGPDSLGLAGSAGTFLGAGGALGAGASGFGSGYGLGGVQNIQGNIGARKQIWDPHAYRHDPRAQAFEQQAEFGGGFEKGDNMKIGERMLKDVTELMHKAHCVGAVKEDTCPKDCPGCPKCEGENKKKADKKPAHGMVIVIGSKAGPGPSKDGKREKVDSEKKEE